MPVSGEARPIAIQNPQPRGRWHGLLEMDFSVIEDAKGNSRLVTGWRERLTARLKEQAAAAQRQRDRPDDFPPAVRVVGFDSEKAASERETNEWEGEQATTEETPSNTSGSKDSIPLAARAHLSRLLSQMERGPRVHPNRPHARLCGEIRVVSGMQSLHGHGVPNAAH